MLMAPTWGGNKSLTKMMLSSDTIASRSVRAEAEGCCLRHLQLPGGLILNNVPSHGP